MAQWVKRFAVQTWEPEFGLPGPMYKIWCGGICLQSQHQKAKAGDLGERTCESSKIWALRKWETLSQKMRKYEDRRDKMHAHMQVFAATHTHRHIYVQHTHHICVYLHRQTHLHTQKHTHKCTHPERLKKKAKKLKWTDEMTYWLKAFSVKPDNQSLILVLT